MDGLVQANEICDDGISTDGIGCKSDCTGNIPGYVCTAGSPTTPSVCSGMCGDNIIVSGEACEDNDGGPFGGDGCDVNCQLESGYTCVTTGNLTVCNPICGDF